MFGGVTDEDEHEETLESVFHNDLYGYQTSGNGRWVSMLLKKPKVVRGKKKKVVGDVTVLQRVEREGSDYEEFEEEGEVRDLTISLSYVLNGNFPTSGGRPSTENIKIRGIPRTARG